MLFSQTWYTNWIGLVKSNRLSNLFRDDVANGQANDLGESTLSQRVTPFAPTISIIPTEGTGTNLSCLPEWKIS